MPAQSIRPSQYIITYGPGSILEGPDGPRVVYGLEHSGVFGSDPIVNYAVHEANLTALLPDNAQVVRLPSNAERLVTDSDPIYETLTFPRWSLCVDHNILYAYPPNSTRTGCPQCAPHQNRHQAWLRSRREAIRFVMACPAGHLDDVNWSGILPHQVPGCAPQFLRWVGGGGALRNIRIVCPDCGGQVNLGAAYSRDNWRCSGSYPERRLFNQGCQRGARIMQRGAANLHVTELVTALTIPRLDTSLHQALVSNQVRPALLLMQRNGQLTQGAVIRSSLQFLADQHSIPPNIITEVNKYTDDMLLQTALDVLASVMPTTPEAARLNEFTELQRAATHGHPSQVSLTPGAPPLFEVIQGRVRPAVPCPGGHSLRITPVSRLRVVMAQTGYRRLEGDLVPTVFIDGQNRWLPGVELHGEGVFIDLTPEDPDRDFAMEHLDIGGPDHDAWLAQHQAAQDDRLHPVFVWWHTLSHRFIRALSVDSGYSSASIRERVYVRIDQTTGRATGGVLLYTAQPGGDGTLGGLIALVPRFERVIRSALRDIDSCSNDPLCNEERCGPGRANGAAFYACQFLSETSCEFRNMHLDRNLLRLHQP